MVSDTRLRDSEPPLHLEGVELLRLEPLLVDLFTTETLGSLGYYALGKQLDEFSSNGASRLQVVRDLFQTADEDGRLRELLLTTKEFGARLETHKGDALAALSEELLQAPPRPSRPYVLPAPMTNAAAASHAQNAAKRAVIAFLQLGPAWLISFLLCSLAMAPIPEYHEVKLNNVVYFWAAGYLVSAVASGVWVGRKVGWRWGIVTAIAAPFAVPAYEYSRLRGTFHRLGNLAALPFPIRLLSIAWLLLGAATVAFGWFVVGP